MAIPIITTQFQFFYFANCVKMKRVGKTGLQFVTASLAVTTKEKG